MFVGDSVTDAVCDAVTVVLGGTVFVTDAVAVCGSTVVASVAVGFGSTVLVTDTVSCGIPGRVAVAVSTGVVCIPPTVVGVAVI